jgi:hypothetical protein
VNETEAPAVRKAAEAGTGPLAKVIDVRSERTGAAGGTTFTAFAPPPKSDTVNTVVIVPPASDDVGDTDQLDVSCAGAWIWMLFEPAAVGDKDSKLFWSRPATFAPASSDAEPAPAAEYVYVYTALWPGFKLAKDGAPEPSRLRLPLPTSGAAKGVTFCATAWPVLLKVTIAITTWPTDTCKGVRLIACVRNAGVSTVVTPVVTVLFEKRAVPKLSKPDAVAEKAAKPAPDALYVYV